jgi:hypothetical protein
MIGWSIGILLLAVGLLCWELYGEMKQTGRLREQIRVADYDSDQLRRYVETVSVLLCTLGNTPATRTGGTFRCSGCGATARDPVNLDHDLSCIIGKCERLGVEGRYLVDR